MVKPSVPAKPNPAIIVGIVLGTVVFVVLMAIGVVVLVRENIFKVQGLEKIKLITIRYL